MVTARFYETSDGWVTMEMHGHAGWGRKGEDLVCAAVSALAGTLDMAVKQLHRLKVLEAPPRVRLRSGEAKVRIKPAPRFRTAVWLIFWTVQAGVADLAYSYPRNVELIETLRVEGGGGK